MSKTFKRHRSNRSNTNSRKSNTNSRKSNTNSRKSNTKSRKSLKKFSKNKKKVRFSENILSNSKKSNIVKIFLEVLNMIKLYHWKTYSYSQHKATDELYQRISELIDKFIEVLMGKDQSRIQMIESKIELIDPNKLTDFKDRIHKFREFLENMNIYFDKRNDSDLLNIRDEMLSDINQFLYLISMNK